MKRLFLLIIVFGCIGTANAQWHFTITSMSYSDACGGNDVPTYGELEVIIMKELAIQAASKTYSSKEECEVHRSIATTNSSNGGCYIRTTTSPCTGGIISGASGPADILAPSQGYSFYSTNPANEVRNWSSDDIERHLALNQQYQTNSSEAINTNDAKFNEERAEARENNTWYVDPDKPFVSVNLREGGSSRIHIEDFSLRESIDKAHDYTFLANQANVQRYVNASTISAESYIANPQDLTQWLHNEFRIVSGFDVDAIMQKLPSERTKAEKQALIDYQEFRKQVTDLMIKDVDNLLVRLEEIKTFEMAVLSDYCYGDSDQEFLSQTNYQLKQSIDFEYSHPMRNLSEIIDQCNTASGFHAEIYYNELTNEYTIAFEGSSFEFGEALSELFSTSPNNTIKDMWNDWVSTNLIQAIGGIPDQYIYAAFIASQIPEGININFVGHSLGGGLASVAGAISGKNTYTFNAEGVNDNILESFGLNEKKEFGFQNIKAYRSEYDILTAVQEDPFIKSTASTLSITTTPLTGVIGTVVAIGVQSSQASIGVKEKIDDGGIHKMKNMVNYFDNKRREIIKKYRFVQNDLYEHGHGTERQTQDSILIIIDD